MKLRKATPADIPAIRTIAHTTWPVAYARILSPGQLAYMLERMYCEAALQEQLTTLGHQFLLAERDGLAIGFSGHAHRHAPGRTRLHKLYVVPEVKGQGVGHALLEAVLHAAHAAGDQAVELNVNKYNPAKDFYLRHGFVVERDEVIDIGQGYVMDDHVLVKPVP